MRSGVLCFYRIGICIFLKRDSGLRRTSEEISFLYTSNPSPKKLLFLRCLPYITNVTLRNTTGHNRRRLISASVSFSASIFFNPLALRALPLSHLRWAEGEETWICHLHGRYFLTPPSCGHLPYILLCKTQRRRLILSCVLCLFFSPAVSRSIAGSCVSNIRKRPKI